MSLSLSPTNRRLVLLVLVQFAALLGTGWATLHNGYLRFHEGDLIYYYAASAPVWQGHLPYRDFDLAYPPFSLVAFLIPHLLPVRDALGLRLYERAFLVESAVWSTMLAVLLACGTSRSTFRLNSEGALTVYALLTLIFSGLLPWRFDLFPTLLTFVALFCLLANRPLASGVWLGLAVGAKLYPAVLLPVFALYLLAQGQRRPALWLGLGCVGASAACLLPFVRVPPASLFQFITFHQHRGLEIESLGAGVILAGHALGWTQAHLMLNYGAFHLASPWAPAILHALPALFLVIFGLTLAGAWSAFRRDVAATGQVAPETLARFVVAALMAFIVCNKVFSTSYVIWLLPFAPLLRPREIAGMVLLFALTIAIYPYNFSEILDMHLAGVLLLNGRNLLLLALLVQLTRPQGVARASAQPRPYPVRMAEA